jgi:RHS repeat-associated protein
MFLDSVQVLANDSTRLGSYTMQYNSTALPSRLSTAQDYWGYFNNKTSNTNLIPKDTIMLYTNMGQPNPDTYYVGGADRSSNESAMQAWILTQLKYPTGGYTDFSYEANKYLDNSTLRTVGGLRIKKMVSYDGKGHTVTRRLKYGSGENGAGTFRDSGAKTVSAEQKVKNPPSFQSYRERTYSSDLVAGLIPQENQVVTYAYVTEYEDDAVGTNGKTVYQFKDDILDIYTGNHATGRQYISSRAWERGQLLSKKVYGHDGNVKAEETNTYVKLGASSSPVIGYIVGREEFTLASPVVDANGCYVNDDVFDQDGYQMYSGILKLSTSQSKTYSDVSPSQVVTATNSYQYNSDYQLKEDRFTNSDGSQRATIYRFCNDISGVTSSGTGPAQAIYRLQQNNQLSKPIEILNLYKDSGGSDRVLTGKLLLDTTLGFNGKTYVLPNETHLLEIEPDGTAVSYSGFLVVYVSGNTLQNDSRYALRLEYDTYDSYGNLTKYHPPAGAPTAMEYTNVSVNSVYHSKITKETANKGGSLEYPTLFAIDKPLLGMKQITAPNGLNTSFEYDQFGRFLRSKDHENKILVEHAYQFAPGNYIRKYLPRITLTSVSGQSYTNVETITGYYDGLGRSLQTVHESGGPDGSTSIVEGAVNYDDYGRINKSFRSYSQTGSTAYQDPGSVFGDSRPFSQVNEYDKSPFHRPKKTFGVGQVWKENDKFVENKYLVAANGEVRKYTLQSGPEGGVSTPSTYGANTLLKNVQISEQGNEIIAYVDNQGRAMQESHQVSGSTYRSLYNIYDRYDRKRYVLQPVYFDQTPGEFDEGDAVFTRYIFGYRYDQRGRLIREHVPGAGWTEYVYDRLDRVVLSQTAQQKVDSGGKWSYIKYGPLGRVIETGVLSSGSSRATLQSSFSQITQAYETWNGTDYTTVSFPAGLILNKRTQNIYDTYPSGIAIFAFDGTHAYGQSAHSSAKGLLTVSLSWDSRTPTKKYTRVYYYNTKDRLIQSIGDHHIGTTGTPLKTSFKYDFAGDLIDQRSNYKFGSLSDVNHSETFTVDHKGRQTGFSAGTAAGTPTLIQVCTSTYDETGRLKNKKYLPGGNFKTPGGPIDFIVRPPQTTQNITEDKARQAIILEPETEIHVSTSPLKTYSAEIDPNATGLTDIVDLQSIDYRYNIRDWLTGINSSGSPTPNALERDLFSLSLEHETAGYYDGNIGKQSWSVVTNPSTNEMKARSYTYTYDASSRLNQAVYEGETNENYDEKDIVYDKNGNITTLKRYGEKNGSYNQLIDNLTYTYDGNRLTRVEDAVSGGTDVDFVNRASAANEYTYFADGSLKTDGNEDIQNIIYDSYLKKPVEIQMTGSRWVKFTYDGHGSLLRRELSTGEVWDYVGNMVLKNNAYYQINMPEGRVVYENNAWHQEYEYRDQVGNLRVAFRERNDSLIMIQSTDYSPFGVQFNDTVYSPQRQYFEYQGHESQPDHGLRRIMMGARCVNPTIGRMDGVDNYASSFPGITGYNWVLNNPNVFIDPDGNMTHTYTGGPDNSGDPGFDNGFTGVSFRAAGYSVGYYDLSGGGYRKRASDVETGRIFNYKGDPNNVKILYDDYWERVSGPAFSQALPNVYGINYSRVHRPVASLGIYSAISDGMGGLGAGFKAQGGSMRFTSGAANGNALSLKYYESGWQGGSRARITTYQLGTAGRLVGKVGTAGTIIVGALDIRNNYLTEDGFGTQTQQATGRFAGSLGGAWLGAKAGAVAGAWFYGWGAIPGAIIGGIAGGLGGSYVGDKTIQGAQNLLKP